MSDDEIAIASCMAGMVEYLQVGKDVYSLEDGIYDAMIAVAMERAIRTGEEIVVNKLN